MNEEQKTMAGASAIGFIIISIFGMTLILSEEDYPKTYYCESTKEIAVFNGSLSSTNRTGYPTNGTTKGYKFCSEQWINIKEYAGKNDIKPEVLLEESIKIKREVIANNKIYNTKGEALEAHETKLPAIPTITVLPDPDDGVNTAVYVTALIITSSEDYVERTYKFIYPGVNYEAEPVLAMAKEFVLQEATKEFGEITNYNPISSDYNHRKTVAE